MAMDGRVEPRPLGLILCPGYVFRRVEGGISLHDGNLGERREALQWARRRATVAASATENSVQHATGRAARLCRIGERRGEFRRRLEAVGRLALHTPEQHLLDRGGKVEVRARGANRRRLAL